METAIWEEALDLVEIDVRITALPGVEHLQVWPIMLRQDATVLLLQLTEFCGTLWIWLDLSLNLLANILWDVKLAQKARTHCCAP